MTRRTRQLFATVLASAALAGTAPAHADSGRDDRSPASSQRMAQVDARPMPATAAQGTSPADAVLLSLFVQGPKGAETHLQYLPGTGWRSVGGPGAAGATHKVSAEIAPEARPGEDEAASSADPLSVFVDGPTGFVFVWTRSGEAWKFIGTVSPRP